MDHPKLAEAWHLPFWVGSELFFYAVFAGALTISLLAFVWTSATALHTLRIASPFRAARYMTVLLLFALALGAPANLLFVA